eukprot:6865662-Pyramimonas_sp.AAC.1
MEMASEISASLRLMDQQMLPWQFHEAQWAMPGSLHQSRRFYFDLVTGEAIYAQSDDVLTEAEIYECWNLADRADQQEARSFIHYPCFRAVHGNNLDSGNAIDAAWVRRWKKMFGDDNQLYYVIKSRLCGRGFLDSSKHD